MFEKLEMAPPDAILGLTAAFKADPNADKINLGVGVYQDANGRTAALPCVEAAEKRLLKAGPIEGYLPIDGAPEYAAVVQALVFGENHAVITEKRAATSQTPGGTGALRVAGDFLRTRFPPAKIWMSEPTWANHGNVFGAAGIDTAMYPYYDAASHSLAFDAMAEALEQVPAGDVVLLHGCCHNPTGVDPTAEQWRQLSDIAVKAGWLPFFDFAYQGLGAGLDEDAVGVRAFADAGCDMLVASSFSKNFGLYCQRVGALSLVASTADAAKAAQSHVKKCIRANYSNPPAHGGRLVITVLSDPELRVMWEEDVKGMRDRINGMRDLFVETLKSKGVTQDFSFIKEQKGMFSFSGLTKAQVDALRQKYSIYIVGSGRINVAGMTKKNMDYLCTAIADVL
ncbi:MAG: amino acid aminotransferase [Candidatus Hydrogenedentota bacterium]